MLLQLVGVVFGCGQGETRSDDTFDAVRGVQQKEVSGKKGGKVESMLGL